MTDTIAAVATAPAKSAIGIIRVDGKNALDIAKHMFRSTKPISDNPRLMCFGEMLDTNGDVIDRGLAVFFNAPHSYTGEHMVELFCHGSPAVLREMLASAFKAGARPAMPGEFTQRAFLNNKLDLTGAEAVIDLIDAETKNAAKNAAAQIDGAVGARILKAHDSLIDLLSEFYAYVDYPDEEIEQKSTDEHIKTLDRITNDLLSLSDSYDKGRLIRDGIKCAIIGRPNVGKSSILNAVLGFERSIVTELEGTTRDTIEESLSFGELKLRLIDTAGIRHTDEPIEKLGVARSEAAASDAELVLAVFDGSKSLMPEDKRVLNQTAGKTTIAVINKSDLPQLIDTEYIRNNSGAPICHVSALNKTGFDELSELIEECFNISGIPCNGETITNPRHAAALKRAAIATASARDALAAGLTPDLAATDTENAVNTLGELTGQTASEEIIRRIFERFCVGK